jgi:hypothetical protein
MKEKLISIHKVNLGFDVEQEIEESLKSKISDEVLDDAKDILDAISDQPGNKKAVEKIETDKKLESVAEHIIIHGSIHKELLIQMTGLNAISAVGKMKGFVDKNYNRKFVKKSKDVYGIDD